MMGPVDARQPKRRRSSTRNRSDGFRPIKQVSYAGSIGFPLIMVGVFIVAIAYSSGETYLWLLAGGLLVGGLLAAASGRIT
jgi:hypothetical protein